MADPHVEVITPPASQALISLADLKIMLGIAASDVSNDPQLQMLIDQSSEVVALKCNRGDYGFGYQELIETWRCTEIRSCPEGARVYLMVPPVVATDLLSVETPVGTVIDPLDYELEVATGRLTLFGGYTDEIVVHYKGGYVLPDDAPLALQQALGLTVQEFRSQAAQAATGGSGVRMLAHKDSRIIYFSPKDMAGAGTTSGGPTASVAASAVNMILSKYTRLWI